MDTAKLKSVFEIGETIGVEFKRCGNGIESDVYETVCSFLNRFGGDIFLGVEDDGTVVGLPEKAAVDMVRNFISCVGNPALFSPTAYLVPEILKYEGKSIMHIHVLPGAEVYSYKKVIYDRVNDSDVRVTATSQIAQMYIRKQEIYTERKIFPYVTLEDLRLDLLPKLRTMAANNSGRVHPWNALTDEELLKSTRLYSMDRVTGESGYNLAAVMLLGKDDVIADVVPAYVTDAVLRRSDVDRYDDREVIKTNLIESYERLMEFARKHLPDKFYFENDQRKSLRSIITREMIANTLIHREYTSPYQAKFIIERSRMYVENANRAARQANLIPDAIEPNPKNPIIASFFRNIGYADQLGSGVRNLFRYSRLYSGEEPEFVEDDIFRITVPLDENLIDESAGEESPTQSATQSATQSENPTQSATRSATQSENPTQSTTRSVVQTVDRLSELTDIERRILEVMEANPIASQREISESILSNLNTVKYYIRKMQASGIIRREGTNRKGRWVILR